MTTLFEDNPSGRVPHRDDPLIPPGQVPPVAHAEYRRAATAYLRDHPGAPTEEVRAAACEVVASNYIDARTDSPNPLSY